WAPGAPGNSPGRGAMLLDSGGALPGAGANAGEGGYVAHALAYLINAPAPWGVGVCGATAGREPVPGGVSSPRPPGFISTHVQHLPGPQPNIVDLNGNTIPGFYKWENHKTTLFNGVYYDACYRTSYGAPGNMAVVNLAVLPNGDGVRLRDLAM